jgi:transcriptional regulator with XRE-family HTH domain
MSEPQPHPPGEPHGKDEQGPRFEPAGVADERFAANIREERERRKLSQGELARRMAERGYPYYQQTIRRIEEGHRKVSVGEGKALAEILHTTVDRLTWPGQVASAAWLLNTAMARADKAWADIARRTRALLYALRQLEYNAADLEKNDCLGSDKLREYVREAARFAEMNPEDAVAAGRGDYEAMTPEELEYKQAEEDQAEAVLRGEGDERS